jgi:hypothetical protein
MATASSLDRLLDPVMSCFTPQVAQRIVDLRLDPELTKRIEYLASRANEGALTPDEEDEYKDYIEGGDLIALLQAKARRFLAQHGK